MIANTPAQAESQQNSLEQAAKGIGPFVNSDKTEFMCFNQDGAISLLNGRPLKLVDRFKYLGSNVSLTESDVNIRIVKTWTTINSLMIIRKSDLSDE